MVLPGSDMIIKFCEVEPYIQLIHGSCVAVQLELVRVKYGMIFRIF